MTDEINNQGYKQAEKEINERYWEKGKRLLGKGVIYVAIPTFLSLGVGMVKTISLKNSPISQEYQNNQHSLSYLRNQLSQYPQSLPEYLSPEVKENLEALSSVDSPKISALEKAIEISEEDSARIVNIPEFMEHQERKRDANKYSALAGLGVALTFIVLLGMSTMLPIIQKRQKKKEVDAVKKRYGIQ